MLEVERVSVRIGTASLLSDISLNIDSGRWLGIIGPNGAGKSTLARAVTGLVRYDGTVRVGGREYRASEQRARARAVAYVPQGPVLPRDMTVTDYVLLGRAAHHSYLGAETARDRRAAAAVLERLDLGALARRPLGNLSGGESQRAVLGRALVQEAPVLVMDEPTASLDLGHAQLVLELADELRRENGLCVLCNMHDLTFAGQYAEELLMLDQGRAVAMGTPGKVLTDKRLRQIFKASVEVVPHADGPAVVPVRPGLGRDNAYLQTSEDQEVNPL